MSNKKALLVGCNYPGTQAALRGCINDVMSIRKLLVNVKGFLDENIRILIDTDHRYEQPTGRNIKHRLEELIGQSRPGDVLVFHFSGHGTQIPEEGHSDEADGKDEAIVPTDLNIMVDDDLRDIVLKLPDGVDLTFISDCCHSGSMLDHAEVLIEGDKSPSGPSLMDLMGAVNGRGIEAKPRDLPIGLLASMLSQQTGQTVKPGNIRPSLGNIFGADASNMVQAFTSALSGMQTGSTQRGQPNMLMTIATMLCQCIQQRQQQQQQQGGGGGFNPGFGGEPVSYPSGFQPPPSGPGRKPDASGQIPDDKGVLITGCQSHETSADACPSGDPSKAFGALTNAIVTVVDRNPDTTYIDLVQNVRGYLTQGKFTQSPQLEGSVHNARKPFICPSVTRGTLL